MFPAAPVLRRTGHMLFQPRAAEGLHRSLVRFDIADRPLRDIAVELERQVVASRT
jgi:hypothetical protein